MLGVCRYVCYSHHYAGNGIKTLHDTQQICENKLHIVYGRLIIISNFSARKKQNATEKMQLKTMSCSYQVLLVLCICQYDEHD